MNARSRSSRSYPLQIGTAIFLLLALSGSSPAAVQAPVEPQYRRLFAQYVDGRSLPEGILNLVGLSSAEVGRSFALVAGVDTYPYLSGEDRELPPAAADTENLIRYLRDEERFDEIVVLRNEDMTLENLSYFLQAYFPARLRSFPHSRFLFAYSGHGIQEGPRGYLLEADARSFEDKAHAVSLDAVSSLYDEILDSAYQSLLLVNSCYSGHFRSRSQGGCKRQLNPRSPGAYAITAGGSHEPAWHDPSVGPGSVFFEKFFKGLEGRADIYPEQRDGTRGDGVITSEELAAYLRQEVQLSTDQVQNPVGSDISKNGCTGGGFFFLDRQKIVQAGLVKKWDGTRPSVRTISGGLTRRASDSLVEKGRDARRQWRFEVAAQQFEAACTAGNQAGCAELGDMVLTGLGGLPKDEARAVGLFRKACDRGNLLGCSALGGAYSLGLGGLSRDPARAAELFRQACDGGSVPGCSDLGVMYQTGQGGLSKDPARAVQLFRQACVGGNALGCSNLGAMYQTGQGGLSKDPARGTQLFKQACAGGNARGCSNLGNMYLTGQGGLSKDPVRAAELFKQACAGGNVRGCSNLGAMYQTGQGGPKNPSRAAELYKKACAGGNALGCSNLGNMYLTGQGGLSKDPARAVQLFKQACAGGNALGCSNLGAMYGTGQGGLSKDPARAVQLYKQACEGGNARGCTGLGNMYLTGQGSLSKNPARAAELFRQACDGEDATGCTNLGIMYQTGQGGPKNPSRAAELYKKACDGGDATGCTNLGVIYQTGQGGVSKDPARAAELFKQGCDGGNATGCAYFGSAFETGQGGVGIDLDRARALYQRGCQGGSDWGCRHLDALSKSHP